MQYSKPFSSELALLSFGSYEQLGRTFSGLGNIRHITSNRTVEDSPSDRMGNA